MTDTKFSSGTVDAQLAKFIRIPFTDDSTLTEVGMDSLSTLRIIVGLVPDDDHEIDAAELAGIRTVGQFRKWLLQLMDESTAAGGNR